jgi:hypothetical protein
MKNNFPVIFNVPVKVIVNFPVCQMNGSSVFGKNDIHPAGIGGRRSNVY